MLNKIFGIYIIKNKINNKVYIGSTTRNFIKRWSIHKVLLRKNKHHSLRLQNSWNKHGENNFSFEVLEIIENKEIIIERENYYLNFYKSYEKQYGYNICKTAHKDPMTGVSIKKEKHGMFNKTHSPESKKKISDNHADFNGEKNGRAKLNWQLVREIREKYQKNKYTLLMLAEEYNVGLSTVSHVIKNETWRENAQTDSSE
jgi:hypothetical protein